MKQLVALFLALYCIPISIQASVPIFPLFVIKEKTSISFMDVRPAYFNVTAQQALWHRDAFSIVCGRNALQFIPFYNHSNKSPDTGAYFLLNCEANPTIKGDSVTTNQYERDIRAEWLGLPSSLNSSFSIRPNQRQVGLFAEYKLNLCGLAPWNFLRNLFVGTTVIFNDVENCLDFSETTSSAPNSILTALSTNSWDGGRFINTSQTGLGEGRASIGIRFLDCPDWEFDFQTFLSVGFMPPKSNANILPATVNFNGHTGWGNIIHMQMPLSKRCSSIAASFFFDLENIFLFQREHCRIFDLFNKQWSRYLLYNNKDGRTGVPGANVLSLRAKVRPYNQVNISTGLRARLCGFELDVGYGIWAHGKEKVKLKKKFEETWGIAGDGTTLVLDDITVGATASVSNIAYLAANDLDDDDNPTFVPITNNDINLDSAAAQSTVAQRGFANIGYSGCTRYTTAFAAIGVYIESPHKNTALFNWGYWIKGGAAF